MSKYNLNFRNKITGLIGNTPLLRLRSLALELTGVKIFAKAEYLNPGGSVKDRAAYAMIKAGITSGELTKDRIILDATSGNTGISYAMIGASLGYKVTLCLPQNATEERKHILKAYGADIIETDPLQSTDGAIIRAKQLLEEEPGKYFYPNQYDNEENWKAHYNATAFEIWKQTGHRITHFVAGLGTSGTFIGTSRRLKELNPEIKVISMQPDSPLHGIEGMKHIPSSIKPGIYDESVADEEIEISTEEAYRATLDLARKEGLFVGISSGGNIAASLKIAATLPEGSVIVSILCDNGYRYLNDELWGKK